MKDWKEQLREISRTLREPDRSEDRLNKPTKVDFDPSKSCLSDGSIDGGNAPSTRIQTSDPARTSTGTRPTDSEVSKRYACSNLNSPSVVTRKTDPNAQGLQAVRTPEPQHSGPPRAAPPLTFRPRVDASRYLSMPRWAQIGKALQHPEARGGAPLPVRVGVDFGTAFTKVVIRAGFDLVIIDWSHVTGDKSPVGRWILPGFVCRGSGGEFGWRRLEGGEWQGNLKLPLVENCQEVACPTATLAFLAEAIRYARAFLYQHQDLRRKLANRTLRWELNLGCPTVPHENPQIVERFRRVACAAWWLASRDHLDDVAICDAWSRHDLDSGLETKPGVIPEFVAQIADYLKSPQVNEGLHALIDVGAATLDVATFNVVRARDGSGAPYIPIFFSAVKPLGTHYISHRRHANLGLPLVWDDAAPLEASADFARRHGKHVAAISGIDAELAKEVALCVARVINDTRNSAWGDPYSPAWREGLPVFFTGGGSTCDVYQRALRESEEAVKAGLRSPTRFKFIEMNLTRSSSQGAACVAATRLSVAIGLTEDAQDIARIIPHRDIEPLTETNKPRVHHEDLYGD